MIENLSSTREAAVDLVLDARERLLSIPRTELDIEKKKDNSFVTRADRDTESFIRKRLTSAFPEHNILGEEFPSIDNGSPFTWVIDPIDGTHSFRYAIPLYGTMLCLMQGDNPIASVIDLPALDRCYSAARGLGAYCNNKQIELGDFDPGEAIDDAVIATGERMQFASCGREHVFDELMAAHDHVRTYCDCFGHALAAEGAVGAMVDFNIRVWDCMASVLLVEEAGGKAICLGRRMDGETQRYDWIFGKPAMVDWIIDRLRLKAVD